MTGFFLGPRIAWGVGAIEQLSGLGAARALLVVDPAVARLAGERRLVEEFAKSETEVETVGTLDGLDRVAIVRQLVERIGRTSPDWIVAVGGGRTIDGVKAARLAAERPDLELAAVSPVVEFPDPARRRLVAIPTTSGSGAEVSWTADLLSDDGTPLELAHRAMMPDWALVDPALASGLAIDRVVDGGFETLGLAVEAYISAWSNPFSDALAREAAMTVVRRLPNAVRWSDDPDARAAMHYAATAAGLAASNAQRGLAHAMARALVEPSGLPYGRLVGILLPHVVEFDHPSARERLEDLSRALADEDERSPVALSARLHRLRETTRLPATLREAGVDPGRLTEARDRIVEAALRSPGALANPRVPSARDVDELLRAVVGSPRPTG